MNREIAPYSSSRPSVAFRDNRKKAGPDFAPGSTSGHSPCGPGELRLLLSGSPIHALVHERMAHELLLPRPVILICGDNGLSTDFLVRKAKNAGEPPESLLSRLYVSRAFTIHQFLRTVVDRLEGALERNGSELAILSGILPLFSDAAVPSRESGRVLATLLGTLDGLSRKGVRILLPLTIPSPLPWQAKSVLSAVFHAASQVETVIGS